MKRFRRHLSGRLRNNASPKATIFPDALVFCTATSGLPAPSRRRRHRSTAIVRRLSTGSCWSARSGAANCILRFIRTSPAYLKVDGDQKVVAAIGKQLTQQKFRRCDGTAKPMQQQPPHRQRHQQREQRQRAGNSAKIFKGYALTELSAAGLLYNAKAKRSTTTHSARS